MPILLAVGMLTVTELPSSVSRPVNTTLAAV
jgi:hypothetical protein